MDTRFIQGIIPPIITPIDAEERIDQGRLGEQLDFLIEAGIDGVLAFGTNGEFYMLDRDEAIRALAFLVKAANGRIPVFMGIGHIRTRHCIEAARAAQKAGAAAVSVLQPMFIRPNEEELFTHFKAIADSVPSLPVLLYNNPRYAGYPLGADLILRLGESVKNIVGIKDSSGDMTQIAELIRRSRGSDFRVLGGKDTLIFATLVHGGAGAVPTAANFAPHLACAIYRKFLAGDLQGALEAQFALNPARLVVDKATFPVGTKDILRLLGRDMGHPFAPTLSTTNEAVLDGMRAGLKQSGLL